jgi:hypothetical protein
MHARPSSPTTTPPPQKQQQEQDQQQEEDNSQEEDAAILSPPEPLAKRLATFYAIQNPRKTLDPSYIIECVDHYKDEPSQL